MTALITIATAPRDLEGMLKVSKAQQYRLALSIGHVQPNTSEAQAFADLDQDARSQEILNAVLQRDANGGGTPAAPTPAATTPQATPAAPAPPAPQAAPAGVAQPAATPARQPATTTDPGNQGASTSAAAGALLQAVTETRKVADELMARTKKLEKTNTITNKELKELKGMMAGLGRGVHILLVLTVNMAEQMLGVPKEALAGLLKGEIDGDVSQLLPGLEDTPGKQ